MRTCRIPKSALRVSRMAYGIGMLGLSWRHPDFIAKCVASIHTAFDCGITFFDTADVYAEGRSEAALGKVIHDSPSLRDTLIIQSKCGLHIHNGWTPQDPVRADSMSVDLSRHHIVKATEASLKRLGTDRLDILLLHAPSPLVQPEEVAQAFENLSTSGKALNFGVCMHSATQIELLKKYVRQPLVINQIWLSLLHHTPLVMEESAFGSLVEYCRLQDIQVQAFSPLKGTDIFGSPSLLDPASEVDPKLASLSQSLGHIAEEHRATRAAVMLAWLLRHPCEIVPIVGASSSEHIVENCTADRVDLSDAEWELLLNLASRANG